MKLKLLENRVKAGYTSFGCIWPRGEVTKETPFSLLGGDGRAYPVQSAVSAFWPDGSVKWTLHTANAGIIPETLEILPGREGPAVEQPLICREEANGWLIDNGPLRFSVPCQGETLIRDLALNGRLRASSARAVLTLCATRTENGDRITRETEYTGQILSVEAERSGPLFAVLTIRGIHRRGNTERFPFILRLEIGAGNPVLRIRHTFEADGDRDQIKAIGLRFSVPLKGEKYNRHIAFATESGRFHEECNILRLWRPHLPAGTYERQAEGHLIFPGSEDEKTLLDSVKGRLPDWSLFDLCQDSADHYVIRKKTPWEDVCLLHCEHGGIAPGAAALSDEEGGIMAAIRDFRQRFPSGLRIGNFETDTAELDLYFHSPSAAPADLRHYTHDAYDQTYYEGFPEYGAEAAGIACSSEALIAPFEGELPSGDELNALARRASKPPVYFGDPEYYHSLRAFGYWGLPDTRTECGRWLEEQLERAFAFYRYEVENRKWYGLFDYGDFMHTYDTPRHVWCYDMGGYAWQNTELMPTMWLWLAFLRSGREDIFSLAEAMTRHCGDVDVYHSGPYRGLGTRHNVRHWGCPCKELRVAMAAHSRYYYFLTGDLRAGEVMDEVKDAEQALGRLDPLRWFYDKDRMTAPTHARSGPDWSALCSDWMCAGERSEDDKWMRKIRTGIEDLKRTPLGLLSGTDFEFDPETCHLIYIGEQTSGSFHLQGCQGAPQVWLEIADLMPEDREWQDMITLLGRFCMADETERRQLGKGLTGTRYFHYPYFAASLGAYAAARERDPDLAARVWNILFYALADSGDAKGFTPSVLSDGRKEIPWISTNFTAQWCLNAITVLDMIPEALPQTMAEMKKRMEGLPASMHHNA